jgi:hypothetical protein
MPTPYKLKILNGVLKLKTFSDQVLSILGIKDLGTRTGNVSNGVVDWSIQHFTKTTAEWASDTTTILLKGQLGLEDNGTNTYKLKIGNGVDLWSVLGYAGGGSSSGVQSVTGDGVDNTDPLNPVLTFPTPSDIGALTSANITQTITNGVTTSAPSEDAVFDALALKANLSSSLSRKYFAFDNTTYTYTGTTAATIVRSIYIPANSMGANSTIEVYATFIKSGTAGSSSAVFYIGTNPSSTVGAVPVGFNATVANGNLQYGKLMRLTNKNSVNSQLRQAISFSTPDFYNQGSAAKASISIDFSVDQYVHIEMVLGNSGDTHGIADYQVYIDHP